MVAEDEPRRGRGRPRTPGAEERILAAALEEYGEHGWAGFTMDAVARRAGVGKSTVYLRWQDKDALLTEAVTSHALSLRGADQGSLEADLVELVVRMLRHFHGPAGWATLRVTFDRASSHERLGQFAESVTLSHSQHVAAVCERATERGEMQCELPTGVISELLYGAAIINSLSERLEGRDDDDAYLQERARQIVGGVLNGITGPAR